MFNDLRKRGSSVNRRGPYPSLLLLQCNSSFAEMIKETSLEERHHHGPRKPAVVVRIYFYCPAKQVPQG
jgi:hypothetical protein